MNSTATSNLGRVLVLDDDPGVNFTICAIARAAGYEAQATTAPDEFFAQVVHWQPTHLIIDLVMPDVDGIETLHELAKTGYPGVVIVASGLGGRVLEAAGRAAAENGLQVSGILAKPFTPPQLRELLAARPNDQLPTAPNQRSDTADTIREDELAEALQQKQLSVYLQPKIACKSGAVVGFESLVRWQHPTRGMIVPDRFIPLAERSGLINELTRQVFDMSLQWHHQHAATPLKMAINMSPVVLADRDFPLWVQKACQRHRVPAANVTLEITETSSMENPIAMLEYLTQFRIKGFHLSIDDFGVGYSSLVQLARLPFSELKIDKMFVMGAANSAESQKIATAVVGLAKALQMDVTAEGVEDAWTLEFLRDIGCDCAQGYFISRPMPAEQASEWLASARKC